VSGPGPAAPQPAGAGSADGVAVPGPPGAWACNVCRLPVTRSGKDPEWGPVVHADTGQETGPDGHVAAPIEAALVRNPG
jgi:hypothetical protein